MKKIVALATAILFCAALALAADAPKGKIKVANFGGKEATTFNHDTHTKGTKCVDCHHKADSKDFKCSGCHNDADKMKDAAHKKEVGKCYGCHNKNSATVVKELKCADCHAG